ncbi:MAG: hypothetical protein ACOZNI_28050 [Myxococcota bacterium]
MASTVKEIDRLIQARTASIDEARRQAAEAQAREAAAQADLAHLQAVRSMLVGGAPVEGAIPSPMAPVASRVPEGCSASTPPSPIPTAKEVAIEQVQTAGRPLRPAEVYEMAKERYPAMTYTRETINSAMWRAAANGELRRVDGAYAMVQAATDDAGNTDAKKTAVNPGVEVTM